MVDLSLEMKNQLKDKDFRNKLRANPKEGLAKLTEGIGWQPDEDTEFVVVTNTKDISYVAIPYQKPHLENELLGLVSAAGLNGPCVSTVCSTLSTATAGQGHL